ncbi:TetR/AcrR family transcriptional regulator [Paracoccus sp. Z330]|uniref:TetR/AcrR family transcriptional regulator n=1 Tax=Paracoccus onchidii TaxID=3017813 RepID=A0ABT4ZBR1_9RHOB|nr:TetR/AcrR family transcriptional regulator [Paracoccus onchidii]MDB6176727.1 TetR/AcrR family transcriptional regulator [Paracoccus onchidii]
MLTGQRLRKGRKLAQVHKGASEIFHRDGYSGASVDDIARAARVSKATLYSYFPEKAAMFQEVILQTLEETAIQTPIRIAADCKAHEGVPELTRQIAAWQLSRPAISLQRLIIAESTRFPDIARRYHAIIDTILHDAIRTHLDRWVERAELTIADTAVAARQLVKLAGASLHDQPIAAAMPPDALDHHVDGIARAAAQLFLASNLTANTGPELRHASG